jgi:hypothetical protein
LGERSPSAGNSEERRNNSRNGSPEKRSASIRKGESGYGSGSEEKSSNLNETPKKEDDYLAKMASSRKNSFFDKADRNKSTSPDKFSSTEKNKNVLSSPFSSKSSHFAASLSKDLHNISFVPIINDSHVKEESDEEEEQEELRKSKMSFTVQHPLNSTAFGIPNPNKLKSRLYGGDIKSGFFLYSY